MYAYFVNNRNNRTGCDIVALVVAAAVIFLNKFNCHLAKINLVMRDGQ